MKKNIEQRKKERNIWKKEKKKEHKEEKKKKINETGNKEKQWYTNMSGAKGWPMKEGAMFSGESWDMGFLLMNGLSFRIKMGTRKGNGERS